MITIPFRNSIFFRSVYNYMGCTTVADYTGLWPQYRVYNPEGYFIGCTNATCEASWKAAVRGIVKTWIRLFKDRIDYSKK